MPIPQHALRLLGLAFVAGLVANILFYDAALGISWPLFVAMVVFLVMIAAHGAGVRAHREAIGILLPIAFVAAMVAIRANELLTLVNVAVSLFGLALLARIYATGGLADLSVLGYALVPPEEGWNAATRTPGALSAGAAELRANGGSLRRAWPVVQGLILAIPVVWIFLALFVSADQVFAKYVDQLADWLSLPDLSEIIARVVLGLVVAWLAAGVMRGVAARSDRTGGRVEGVVTALARMADGRLNPLAAAVLLAAIAALFATFVAVQVAYLFGGEATVKQAGFTYAEYARRGFFELLMVAGITLALVMAVNLLVALPTAADWRRVRWLETLLNGLVFVILASAFKRLALYEAAYGYTELRLYAYLTIVTLAIVFAWYVFTLWWRPERFAVGVFIVGVATVAAVNLLNPDAFIARQNLARLRTSGRVDAAYLGTLSMDAWPVVVPALSELSDPKHGDPNAIRKALSWQRYRLESRPRLAAWPSWHASRAAARRLTAAPSFPAAWVPPQGTPNSAPAPTPVPNHSPSAYP